MTDHKIIDEEVTKAFDILDKFEFFGGQRAGRQPWFNKPTDIQNKDIGKFLRDLDFLKRLINRQKAEIERLEKCNDRQRTTIKAYHSGKIRVDVIKEYAERLKATLIINNEENTEIFDYDFTLETIDQIAKEMTEREEKA